MIIRDENGHECQRMAYYTFTEMFEDYAANGLTASYSMESDVLYLKIVEYNRFRVIPRDKSKMYEGELQRVTKMPR